jgi:hypothetical protein
VKCRAIGSLAVVSMVLALVVGVPVPAASDGGGLTGTGSGPVTHVRWVITALKGSTLVQAADLVLLDGGVPLQRYTPDSGIVVTNPDGSNPWGEEPEKGYDGDDLTKWLDFNFNAEVNGVSVLVIQFPAPVNFDSYHWVTGNDAPDRDPVSWSLEVSVDGVNWTVVDVRSEVDVVDDRFTIVGPFPASGSPPAQQPAEVGPTIAVSCAPSPPQAGRQVSCAVTGGPPEVEILWRAAYNPVFVEAGVLLDAEGVGEFSFMVPTAALGRELTVELVEWSAAVSLGPVRAPLPGAVRAGEGPTPVRTAGSVALLFTLLMIVSARALRPMRDTTARP